MKFISKRYPNLVIHHPTGSNVLGVFVNGELETEDAELVELLKNTDGIEMLEEETLQDKELSELDGDGELETEDIVTEKPKSSGKRGK